MRAYRPQAFRIFRYHDGWACEVSYDVLTATEPMPQRKEGTVYGKLRFLTYVRSVFAARKKARAERAERGQRHSLGWPEHGYWSR